MMDHLDLAPIRFLRGTVKLPGSKSISNRTLLLAALAAGETRLYDVLESDDTRHMLEALKGLGVAWQRESDGCLLVQGAGGRFPVRNAELFLGNAGTAFRPLTAVLALNGGQYRLSGVPRMHERPIGDLVAALRGIGASVEYLGKEGYPPLLIGEGDIDGAGPARVKGNVSSQFVTALLMALPLRGQAAELVVEGELISKPYVELTLRMLDRFGVHYERDGWNRFSVAAGAGYRSPGVLHVEGDASSASYFLAAGAIGALAGGAPVRVDGVGRDSVQGDIRFADALTAMGADVRMGENWMEVGVTPEVRNSGRLKAIDGDFNHIPDAAMTLGVAALFADGPSILRNIASWRVKETDRLSAMATELRKLGAQVDEGPDYLRIVPPARLTNGASIDTYDDHRMAMCFSLAALGGVSVRINDPGCVAKTFPQYFNVLQSLAVR
jgi:3-phosphoshikimate 1-carboxyvinyltransferase